MFLTMNNEGNKLIDRKGVLEYLFEAKKQLMIEFEYELSGIYAYGSLINEDGIGFSTLESDVDLMITTRQMDLYERIEFSEKLRTSLEHIEEHLKTHLKGRTNNGEEDKRTFLPVISVCLVNAFELDNGIHKNRNSADAFAIPAFHRLTNHQIEIQEIGNRLQSDLVGVNFPAWAILTQVQEMRSIFVSPKAPMNEKNTKDSSSNHPFLTLPKELLRYAYLLKCFESQKKPEIIVEDDLGKGLNFIIQILSETAEAELKAGTSDNSDVQRMYAKKLLNKIESNLTGKRIRINQVTLQEELFLWEILSLKATSALQIRRRQSDLLTLKKAADPVVLELSRLHATTLMSVDMAVSLAYKEDDLLEDGMFPVVVAPHQSLELYKFSDLDFEHLALLAKDWPEDVEKFLLTQHGAGKNCGESECKIGFAGYLYTQKAVQKRPKLLVRPLTYWIIQQFNKQMAANPRHPQLRRLRERYGRKLFTSPEDFTCGCPSALYVEVVIITKDNYVFKIPKLARNSAFSKLNGGQVFTCGVEWGFSWNEHLVTNGDNKYLDVRKALLDGLEKEFSIKQIHVKDWKISTLAIQHGHLNAGLLGLVHLNLTRGSLYTLLDKTKNKYHDKAKLTLIEKNEAIQLVHSDKNSGRWHQSALMRLNLLE
jgi:predicted nucleotidyltransferase